MNLQYVFDFLDAQPNRFSFTLSFTKHVILLIPCFLLFEVKRCPLLRGVVTDSAIRLLGGSLYFIVSTGLRLLWFYIFFCLLYLILFWYCITMFSCLDIAV